MNNINLNHRRKKPKRQQSRKTNRLTTIADEMVANEIEHSGSNNNTNNSTNNTINGVETDIFGDTFDMNIDHTYEFNYGFLRDVLYEQMLHTQKKALHVSAKKYLETLLSQHGYDGDLEKLVQKHTEYAQNLQNHVQSDNPNILTKSQQRKSHLWRSNGPLIDNLLK